MIDLGWPAIALAVLVGVVGGGASAWVWQANDYGAQLSTQKAGYESQLADKDVAHGREREAAATAALDQLEEQQEARRALEDRLKLQGETHWKEMNDAQETQVRLRDRLATADVRLSVLLDAGAVTAACGDGGGRASAGTGSLVAAAVRAQLDPTHAQRIIAITDEGDRGLIALQACQAYVREVTK